MFSSTHSLPHTPPWRFHPLLSIHPLPHSTRRRCCPRLRWTTPSAERMEMGLEMEKERWTRRRSRRESVVDFSDRSPPRSSCPHSTTSAPTLPPTPPLPQTHALLQLVGVRRTDRALDTRCLLTHRYAFGLPISYAHCSLLIGGLLVATSSISIHSLV